LRRGGSPGGEGEGSGKKNLQKNTGVTLGSQNEGQGRRKKSVRAFKCGKTKEGVYGLTPRHINEAKNDLPKGGGKGFLRKKGKENES